MKQEAQSSETTKEKKELKAPQQPLSYVYADCKQQVFTAVRKVMNNYRLPLFLAEGILESVLSEYRHEAYLEFASESVQLKFAQDEYTEERLKALQEQHDAETRELIAQFEAGPDKPVKNNE